MRLVALAIGLAALVAAVVEARKAGSFPLGTLVRRWFGRPAGGRVAVAVSAGVVSVIVVPLIAVVAGRAQIVPAGGFSGEWLGLAVAGVAVKAAFVFFEEAIFRGALVSELRRLTHPVVAAGVAGLVFAAAHVPRSLLDTAVLAADGIGFGIAFLLTESLWFPFLWHLAKNLSVWFILGNGTIDLTHGPLSIEGSGPAWLFGSDSGAGLLDVIVTVVIVALVSAWLWRSRPGRSVITVSLQVN